MRLGQQTVDYGAPGTLHPSVKSVTLLTVGYALLRILR